MYEEITSFEEFTNKAQNEEAALFYFSHEDCNVCKVLKPKIAELVWGDFPDIKLFYVDTKNYPDVAAQNSIFTNPVILIYFQGKEFYRKARNIGISELHQTISKPYGIMFN